MTLSILRKLRRDFHMTIRDHEWLGRALKRYAGYDHAVAAFCIACDWHTQSYCS